MSSRVWGLSTVPKEGSRGISTPLLPEADSFGYDTVVRGRGICRSGVLLSQLGQVGQFHVVEELVEEGRIAGASSLKLDCEPVAHEKHNLHGLIVLGVVDLLGAREALDLDRLLIAVFGLILELGHPDNRSAHLGERNPCP